MEHGTGKRMHQQPGPVQTCKHRSVSLHNLSPLEITVRLRLVKRLRTATSRNPKTPLLFHEATLQVFNAKVDGKHLTTDTENAGIVLDLTKLVTVDDEGMRQKLPVKSLRTYVHISFTPLLIFPPRYCLFSPMYREIVLWSYPSDYNTSDTLFIVVHTMLPKLTLGK
jgi:hypothetical protein